MPRKHKEVARTRASERRARTYPHNIEYGRSHFFARSSASRPHAAEHSSPRRPSTEKTRGVNWRCASRHGRMCFLFFAFSAFSNTFAGAVFKYPDESVSVTWTSKIAVVPRFQKPRTATSPRVAGGMVALLPFALDAGWLFRLDGIKGSSETAPAVNAWAHRSCHSPATSLCRATTRPPTLHFNACSTPNFE